MTQATGKRRRGRIARWTLALGALTLLIIALAYWDRPPDLALMNHATAITPLDPLSPMPGGLGDYIWHSDHEILIMTGGGPLYRLNLKTGQQTIETRTQNVMDFKLKWIAAIINKELIIDPSAVPSVQSDFSVPNVQKPTNGKVMDTAVSPQGDRRAWLLNVQYAPGLATFLHRVMPFFKVKPNTRLELWTSRADGSGLKLHGYLDPPPTSKPLPAPFQNLLATEPYRESRLQWTPDGKRLSFVYKKTLWTVPASN